MVHAGAKSGTSPGLSTGGGLLGDANGYTPGIGGSEEGDGNGTKAYERIGIPDGNGWVRTLGPLVDKLRELKRGGEAPVPDEDVLIVPEVGIEGEYDERENDGEEGGKEGEKRRLEGVRNGGTGDEGRYDDRGGKRGEDTAKECPAMSRTRKAECRIDSQYRCTTQGKLGEDYEPIHTELILSRESHGVRQSFHSETK